MGNFRSREKAALQAACREFAVDLLLNFDWVELMSNVISDAPEEFATRLYCQDSFGRGRCHRSSMDG
jgi:hypothetical protein